MSHTPFANAEALRIGTVDAVSPDEVKVLLDIEAPDVVALNAGGARPFPRVNGYVLVPVEDGYLVGQIDWLTIERSAFPKRRGVRDFGVIDLPYPLRKMSLNPLGTLRKEAGSGERYRFRRGSHTLPSVGVGVLLPTDKQLRSIVESGEHRRVRIGASPLANAEVRIDPDRLFGRHLAVLGSTGSGKSCSVAGLIRWSLEAARAKNADGKAPNARFIVLDPNGEYSRAFSPEDAHLKARIFRVNPEAGEFALKVPLWFWNSAEWIAFSQASAKAQRPLLKRALREVKAGRTGAGVSTDEERKLELRRYLSSTTISIQQELRSGSIKAKPVPFGFFLKAVEADLASRLAASPDHHLQAVVVAIRDALAARRNTFKGDEGKTVEIFRSFTEQDVGKVTDALRESLETLGGLVLHDGPDEDVPIPFRGTDLADHLQMLSAQEGTSQYVDFLVSRIRTFLADARTRDVVGDHSELSLGQWLASYIGGDGGAEGPVAILDLSLVPTEVVHVITAVAARMIFEALQRYRKLNKMTLPTVLVMEEAHTFIRRYRDDVDDRDAATACCQVFERIAREGRKFGLGLVLSSQRPSELSPTVLSQCNTYLLHRITNDKDQDLVQRLVPDALRSMLRELPSLPAQHAILLGWAAELPVLVRIDDLPTAQQPRSDDPEFWNVWTRVGADGRRVERTSDWDRIAADWQGRQPDDDDRPPNPEEPNPKPVDLEFLE